MKPIVSIAISAFFYSIGMAPMANAFLSGFIDGYMATGSLGEAMGGAAFSMISAGVAQGIGHAPPLQKIYAQQGGKFIKASLHGVSRAAISKARYGTSKGAFGAGFFASLMGGATEGLNGTTRVVASAIVGGTASSIGGGKFANGAMSGAFIVLFNDMATQQDKYWPKAEVMRGAGYRPMYEEGLIDFSEILFTPFRVLSSLFSGSSVTAYRAVSTAELRDISVHGFRANSSGSMGAKWFSESHAGATKFMQYYPDLDVVIRAKVPNSVYQNSYKVDDIDLTGPGFAVPESSLSSIKMY